MAYIKRQPEGWKDAPDPSTPVMGADLDHFENTFDAHDKALAGKASSKTDLLDPVTGQPNGNSMDTNALVSMLYYMLTINQQKALRLYNTTGVGPTELLPNIIITDALPPTGGANPNSVYFILAPDGTVSVHIPRLENV